MPDLGLSVSEDHESFSSALDTARANIKYGAAVDGKTAEELKGATTLISDDKTAGAAVMPDGDITAVFKDSSKNKTDYGGRDLIISAVAVGGKKLDCYGKRLVNIYTYAGMVPVARVKYQYGINPAMDMQVREDLASCKISIEPDIYFMKLADGYNDRMAAEYAANAHTYSQAELDALPEMDYDAAWEYRDGLLANSALDRTQSAGYDENGTRQAADLSRSPETQYSTVAPYRNTSATSENVSDIRQVADKAFREKANDIAGKIGITVDAVGENLGGYTFEDGNHINEINYQFKLGNATPEQADLFTSLMADNGFEQQEAAIVKNYVNNIDDGNAMEYTVYFDGITPFEVVEILSELGIGDYTIHEDTNSIELLNFDMGNDSAVKAQIKQIIDRLGGRYRGSEYSAINSRALDERSRSELYRSWNETGQQDGQLRGLLAGSLQKVQRSAGQSSETGTEISTNETGEENAGPSFAKTTDTSKTAEKEGTGRHSVGADKSRYAIRPSCLRVIRQPVCRAMEAGLQFQVQHDMGAGKSKMGVKWKKNTIY